MTDTHPSAATPFGGETIFTLGVRSAERLQDERAAHDATKIELNAQRARSHFIMAMMIHEKDDKEAVLLKMAKVDGYGFDQDYIQELLSAMESRGSADAVLAVVDELLEEKRLELARKSLIVAEESQNLKKKLQRLRREAIEAAEKKRG